MTPNYCVPLIMDNSGIMHNMCKVCTQTLKQTTSPPTPPDLEVEIQISCCYHQCPPLLYSTTALYIPTQYTCVTVSASCQCPTLSLHNNATSKRHSGGSSKPGNKSTFYGSKKNLTYFLRHASSTNSVW